MGYSKEKWAAKIQTPKPTSCQNRRKSTSDFDQMDTGKRKRRRKRRYLENLADRHRREKRHAPARGGDAGVNVGACMARGTSIGGRKSLVVVAGGRGSRKRRRWDTDLTLGSSIKTNPSLNLKIPLFSLSLFSLSCCIFEFCITACVFYKMCLAFMRQATPSTPCT